MNMDYMMPPCMNYMMPMRSPCDNHMMPAMSPCDSHMMPAMSPCDSHMMPAMSPYDSHMMPTMSPYDSHMMPTMRPEYFLERVRPLVRYGLKESEFTNPKHAMTEVTLIAYLMGMGYDINTARTLVESWEIKEEFPEERKI